MTDALTLGTQPGALVVNLPIGDPFSAALILTDADTGVPTAWPAAPVLEFADPVLNITATLSADAGTSTPNAQATWAMTQVQVDTFTTKNGSAVRLSVSGDSWWRGVVKCLS